jgi:hypothetical protein
MKDQDQSIIGLEAAEEQAQQEPEAGQKEPKPSKVKQSLGLQDAPGPISERKEKRVNRAVAKAVERDLSDKVTLGEKPMI